MPVDAVSTGVPVPGLESAVATTALLQDGGPEGRVAAADLGHGEVEPAHRGVESARLEDVGVAVAGLDAFVGPCPEVFGVRSTSMAAFIRISAILRARRRGRPEEGD